MSDIDNLAAAEIDTTRPETEADTDFSNWHDPDEDNAPEGDAAEGEVLPSEQDAAGENETEGQEQDAQKPETVKATLPDGTEVPVSELIAGYMKDADYRQKTAAVAEGRRTVEATVTRVSAIAERLADRIASFVPPQPDPALAFSDPAEHYRQTMAYNQAAEAVAEILAAGQQLQDGQADLSADQHNERTAQEAQLLQQAHPELADKARKEAFFRSAFEAAAHFGFAPDEVRMISDHRIFRLARYAALGLKAEAAQAKTQQALAKAPPIPKPRANTAPASSAEAARRRFYQTGKLEDALALDF